MKVIIRISGLDGEATENRVSNLVDDSEDDKTAMDRIKLTEVFQNEYDLNQSKKINGFKIILNKIKAISYVPAQKPLLKKIVKLLMNCSKIQENRKLILKQKGVPLLLELLLHLFPTYEEDEQDSIVENLLAILETVLKESDKDPKGQMDIEQEIQKETSSDFKVNVDNIHLCMKKISHESSPSHSKVLSNLTKIMPFLTGNKKEPSEALLGYFD